MTYCEQYTPQQVIDKPGTQTHILQYNVNPTSAISQVARPRSLHRIVSVMPMASCIALKKPLAAISKLAVFTYLTSHPTMPVANFY